MTFAILALLLCQSPDVREFERMEMQMHAPIMDSSQQVKIADSRCREKRLALIAWLTRQQEERGAGERNLKTDRKTTKALKEFQAACY